MMISDVKTFRELANRIHDRGDRLAMMERRNKEFKKITYKEISDMAKALSAFLISKNIKKPTKVAILSKNRMEWGISYLGITYGGCIAIPIDPELKEKEITHILQFSETKTIFTTKKFIKMIKDIATKLQINLIITLDNSGEIHFKDAISDGKKLLKEIGEKDVEVEKNDIASIIFTSGTTGVSKGVELTHHNFIYDTVQSEKLLNLLENEVFLSVLPIHHTFEFTGGFLEPLMCGGLIVYARSLKSKELLEDLKDSKTTLLLGVPLLFEKLYKGIRREISKQNIMKKGMVNIGISLGNMYRNITGRIRRNFITQKILKQAGLDSLRIMIAGGAALDPEVELGIKALGLNLIQGYGLTEASPIVTINPAGKSKPGSIGKPIPGIELKIYNPDLEGIGEIIIIGDNVMKGYYKNPLATEESIRDGYLHTGDMGYIDEDGYVYITGRKKSIIITDGGKNIYPEEIEQILSRSDFIEEVLVIDKYNKEKNNTELVAIIYPDWEILDSYIAETKQGESDINEILREQINNTNKQIASYKHIHSFEIREEEFPKTSTRKIKRYLFEEERIPVE
jgi:long-chain acyl-CoA synthetase